MAAEQRKTPTLILTRPRQQAGEWLTRLAALGVQARSLPLIEIAAAADASAGRQAWQSLPDTALAMFVSPNAVEQFFALRPPDAVWPSTALAATVGPGSAKALLAAGVPPELIVQPPPASPSLDSEHLWPELSPRSWVGKRVLVLRGDGGREWLAEQLRAAGAHVDLVSVYRRRVPTLDKDEQALLRAALSEPERHVWLFSSSEAITHLAGLAAGLGLQLDRERSRCLVTHPRIGEAARTQGLAHVVLTRPDASAVAQTLLGLMGADLQ